MTAAAGDGDPLAGLDPHARRFLHMMAMGGAPEPTIAGRRAALRGLARLAGARDRPPPVRSADLAVSGADGPLAARLYAPEGRVGETLPGLVFFHGGGLVAGDLDTHDGLCRALCAAGGLRVVAIDYRLAPEHPFPAAVEDALSASAWVADNASTLHIDPQRLAVGGDSAGAGLAAVVCQQAGAPYAAQMLLCPVLDPLGDSPSRRAFAAGCFLDVETIARDAAALGLPARRADPRARPLRARRLAGLPPALIHTAAFDPVRDDGEGYARRLAAAAVPVRLTRHAGMIHSFYWLAGLIPAARPALAAIGAELAALLDEGLRRPRGAVVEKRA